MQQGYDGDGLRAQKTEYGATTYYLRSTVLGGQVVAEVDGNGGWQRGYVYAGSSLLAVQQGGVNWVHEDSMTKSKRVTDIYGNIVSTVELDPWGADTNRSSNSAFQPQNFTSYIRDGNGGQDAMARRYSVGGRFSQPDPYGGSYDFSDPQSLNRYAYTKNDPVNFRDPSGLELCFESWCTGGSDGYGAHVGWGTTGSYFGSYGNPGPGFSSHIREAMAAFDHRVQETIDTLRLREPQNTTNTKTDCQRFADMVQDIANGNGNVRDFLDAMARTFTGADNSSIGEMNEHANRGLRGLPGRVDFGPSNGPNGGFKEQFRDPSNQARHFVGGLIAGANLGSLIALRVMNQREEPNTNGQNNADLALNSESTGMGAEIMMGQTGINRAIFGDHSHRTLADRVRKGICE